MLGHLKSKAATALSDNKRSAYMKDVSNERNWTFKFEVGDGIAIPFYVIVGFMQRDQLNQQHQNNDTFYRPSVVNAHCIIGSKKYLGARIDCNYAIDKNSQAYREIVSCFRHLAKDKTLQPYNTKIDFITSTKYPEGNPGFKLYVFDIRDYQDCSPDQPIRERFFFRPAATSLFGYALLQTKKSVSVSNDGRRQFDLV